MRKFFLLLAVCFFMNTVFAQSLVVKKDSGSINGAKYIILFPANWKSKLVMYAHGYEFMGTMPRQSQNTDFANSMTPFLERGFAVAASDYSIQGFALPQGIQETEELRQYFVNTYGKPDTAFIVGHSMGGGVTVGTIENFGANYNGGLPLCPLSSRPYLQCRKEFDIYAAFNALFPGIVPKLSEIFDISNPKPATSFNEMMPKVMVIKKAIVDKDSALGVAFAKRFDLKFDDLPFSLFFNENVLRDIAAKAGGNPFDNTNTIYSGFPDNWEINKKVERLAATADPNKLFGKFDRTGNINKPIVLMHTIYDQLIPPVYGEVNFENMVTQQGKLQYLTVKYTNGQGHCNFTPQQTGQAFDELRQWAKTGQKAKVGIIQ